MMYRKSVALCNKAHYTKLDEDLLTKCSVLALAVNAHIAESALLPQCMSKIV